MNQESPLYPSLDKPQPAMNREQLAWIILLTAFAIFCALAVGIPLSVRWYVHTATRPQLAVVKGSAGKPVVQEVNMNTTVAVPEGERRDGVQEGARILTDRDDIAEINFFDGSTLLVFPYSEVTIERMRKPRFERSPNPNEVVLQVSRGQIRLNLAPPLLRKTDVQVKTPHALATLEAGSYSIEVSTDETTVIARSGVAYVQGSAGEAVRIEAGERTSVGLSGIASPPLPAERNLIVNGDFANPTTATPITQGVLAEGWVVYNDQGGDGGTVDGTAAVMLLDGRRVVQFKRTNSGNNHGETGIRQTLNRYLGLYESLHLAFDVKLIHQSLSGGGQLSSEFPLMVRIDYKDVYGNDNHWVRGFYYQNDAGFYVNEFGQRIPRDTWVPIVFENLQDELQNAASITTISIYASGWDYESYVSQVELLAR